MGKRVEKVAELLKQQLSNLILNEMPPELGLVTVTLVDVTADFKEAKVYVSCLNKAGEQKIFKVLEEKRVEFQKYLGENLQMKFTPKLEFLPDFGGEKIERVEKILKSLEK